MKVPQDPLTFKLWWFGMEKGYEKDMESLNKRLDIITFWLIGSTILLILIGASSFALSINQIEKLGLFLVYVKMLAIVIIAIIFIAFMAAYGRLRTNKAGK
jgi:uncharacterized Tic20 family protein